MKYEKSFYQVFRAYRDMFDYSEYEVLFEDYDLGQAHSYAYELWKKNPEHRYTIIQPYDGSCRGGYGFPEDEE